MKISSVKNSIVYKNYNKPNVAFLAKKNDYLNNEQGFLDSVVSFAKLRTNGFSVGYSLGSCAYTKAEIDTMIKLKKLGFSEEACILGSKLKEDKIKFAVGLKEIGEAINVSESRVCQLHAQAIMKLRNILSANRSERLSKSII